jgi:hypothetical protein
MRYMLGHDGPPTNYWRENLLTRAPLAECPLRTIIKREATHPDLARELSRHFGYYAAYERGALLVAGGVADQPNRYLDFMVQIDERRAAAEARYYDLLKAEAEAEQQQARPGARDG